MGKSSGDTETTIRYAPYIEDAHKHLIEHGWTETDLILHDSPFSGFLEAFSGKGVEVAFFGTGYTIASFPTLYDMFGKFMAGLDVEVLYEQVFEDTCYGNPIDDLVGAEAVSLDDQIEATAIPRLQGGMRDINAVASSAFIVGKSLIEEAKIKAISKFSSEVRTQAMNIALQKWSRHLDWCHQVSVLYAELTKLYFTLKMDKLSWMSEMKAKDKLWAFTVLGEQRTLVGALAGTAAAADRGKPSPFARAVSGALSGAAAGAMVGGLIKPAVAGVTAGGGPVGALIGGLLGLAGGLFG